MDNKIIVISGPWASGKTGLVGALHQKLKTDGEVVRLVSDRILLEEAARFDYDLDESGVARRDSVFIGVEEWGERGHVKFLVKDGFAMRRVHEFMAQAMQDHAKQGEGILIAELAIGPNIDLSSQGAEGEWQFLRQETDYLAQLFFDSGLNVAGTESEFNQIQDPWEARYKRQAGRKDSVAEDAFQFLAGDGGGLTSPGRRILRDKIGFIVETVNNDAEVKFDGLTEYLFGIPMSREDAYASYSRLLSDDNSQVLPPRDWFEGHPKRLSNTEGGLRRKEG